MNLKIVISVYEYGGYELHLSCKLPSAMNGL